ncbi:MAG: CDP-diacylglycerol--glycerol-3-phosphate 3-phosphatidyltransferase [Candidatus Babeliales bacterium]
MKPNFPTFLTLIRLILSPIILPLLLVYLLPLNSIILNSLLALLFIFFSLTDFFDGYLARRLRQETAMGKALDPLADKFLVFSVLVALLAVHKIYFYWVIIFIGREFFVMGLRQIALEKGLMVHVAWLGKLKTALQMIYLTVAIVNPYQGLGFVDNGIWWNGVETGLLAVTLMLSLVSAYCYYRAFITKLREHNEGV